MTQQFVATKRLTVAVIISVFQRNRCFLVKISRRTESIWFKRMPHGAHRSSNEQSWRQVQETACERKRLRRFLIINIFNTIMLLLNL